MSHETFELIDRLRQAGRPAAMATLVRTIGTTPRKEGTKMFVGDDGNIFGSVTIGGCVDARVIEQSNGILSAGAPRLFNLKLGDEEAWEIGLSCGGAVDVFIEPFTDEIARVYESARREWQAGRAVAIATILSGKETGARQLMTEDRAAEWPAQSGTVTRDGREVYVELLRPPSTPIVLVSHDDKIEVPILTKVLASDAPYIGLLAGRKRGAALLEVLRDDGVAENQLARVRVPVGLDIGGESAAEIALSIVAEIVAVMRGRKGASLSAR